MWAVAAKMSAYSLSTGLVHSCGRCTKGFWWICNASLPCLPFSGRNLYPQPLLRHTQQGPLLPGVWVRGSVRTDHHCFRGLNPLNGGPYQVFLTIWHLSVFLRPPTLSERFGLLLANNLAGNVADMSPTCRRHFANVTEIREDTQI